MRQPGPVGRALNLVTAAALVVMAVAMLVIGAGQLQRHALTRRQRCYGRTFQRVAPQYRQNATVVAARACGERDPAPHLPVGLPQ